MENGRDVCKWESDLRPLDELRITGSCTLRFLSTGVNGGKARVQIVSEEPVKIEKKPVDARLTRDR